MFIAVRRVFSNLTNVNFFQSKGNPSVVTTERCSPHSPLSRQHSDHRLAKTPEGTEASYNMQMKGDGRNNGFGTHETNAEYIARLSYVLAITGAFTQRNVGLNTLFLQEAPINRFRINAEKAMEEHFSNDFKPSNKDLFLHQTNWGLVTCINFKKLECSKPEQIHTLTQNIAINDIKERFVTFRMIDKAGNPKYITNLHLPFLNPHQFAHIALMKTIKHLCENDCEKPREHMLIGDWNLGPDELQTILHDVGETVFPDSKPKVRISIQISTSQEGHLKRDGSLHSVDHKLLIRIKPASQYEYKVHYGSALFFICAASCFAPIPAFTDTQAQSEKEEEILLNRASTQL